MTRILGVSGAAPALRRPSRAGGGFALPASAAEATAAQGAAGVAPVLLALQEAGDGRGRSAAAMARASAMLAELRDLQLAMLRDGPDPARLAHLAALADSNDAADPALAKLLSEVSLRARVELARYRRAPRRQD